MARATNKPDGPFDGYNLRMIYAVRHLELGQSIEAISQRYCHKEEAVSRLIEEHKQAMKCNLFYKGIYNGLLYELEQWRAGRAAPAAEAKPVSFSAPQGPPSDVIW